MALADKGPNMKALIALAALPMLMAAAPASAQNVDGCKRLPSAARVIVIDNSCGTARIASNTGNPVLVYGTSQSSGEIAGADSPNGPASVTNNVVIAILGARRAKE